MVNSRKCGDNLMQASETTISFTTSPTGEGKWYATREYHVLNCLLEKITLKQNPEEHLIESPFGIVNATQEDKQITYNHNTIVWGRITSNFSSTVTLFKGQGYLELTQTDVNNNISRLVDTQRQIEISFYNIPDRLNYDQATFPVVGMPKTFLIFPTNTSENLYQIYRHAFLICKTALDKANSEFCKHFQTDAWPGHHNRRKRNISQNVKFIYNKDEEVTEDNRLYSISYAWGTITLKDEVDLTTNYLPSTTQSLEKL
jgi:regulator of replication initiation timing